MSLKVPLLKGALFIVQFLLLHKNKRFKTTINHQWADL